MRFRRIIGWTLIVGGGTLMFRVGHLVGDHFAELTETTRQRTWIALAAALAMTLLGAWILYRGRRLE